MATINLTQLNKVEEMMTLTNDIAEWDYGDHEGLVVNEIRALRKERGLDREREWNIWKDGCEGGEYVCRYTTHKCGSAGYSLS